MSPSVFGHAKNSLLTPAVLIETLEYARHRRQGRWWEWEEQALAMAPHHPELLDACVEYAREVIGGRWAEANPVLLQVFISKPVAGIECVDDWYEVETIGRYVWNYLDVLNERWTDWETQMLVHAAKNINLLHTCVRYAKERVGGRWPDLEQLLLDAILSAPESFSYTMKSDELIPEWVFALDYASEVLKGDWPELESLILNSGCLPAYGVYYAIEARKTRWPDLEKRMLGSDYGSPFGAPLNEQIRDIFRYACALVEGPWPEAESFITTDLRSRSPQHAAWLAVDYAEQVIGGRWEPGENQLSGFPQEMWRYAREVLKRPLPTHLHNEMLMRSYEDPDNYDIREYVVWCKTREDAPEGMSS
jgi:hypothetical protein